MVGILFPGQPEAAKIFVPTGSESYYSLGSFTLQRWPSPGPPPLIPYNTHMPGLSSSLAPWTPRPLKGPSIVTDQPWLLTGKVAANQGRCWGWGGLWNPGLQCQSLVWKREQQAIGFLGTPASKAVGPSGSHPAESERSRVQEPEPL